MNYKNKILAATLTAAMLLTSGCSIGENTTWVYQNGEDKTPAGVYLMYMLNAAQSAENKVMEQRREASSDDIYEALEYKDVLKQTIEGKLADQWIIDETDRQMKEFLGIEAESIAREIALTDSELATARSSAAGSWQSSSEMYEQNGISENSMRLQTENYLKRESLFHSLYGDGGEFAPTEQEKLDAFVQSYFKIDMMIFQKATTDKIEDDKTITAEEQNAENKSRAEKFAERLKNGENFEELVFEQEKQDAGENAASLTKPEEGSREAIIEEDSYYSKELTDGVKALNIGEIAALEDDSFYYVVRKKDITEDPEDMANYSETLLHRMKNDEFAQKMRDRANELPLQVNTKAIDRYKPSRLKLAV